MPITLTDFEKTLPHHEMIFVEGGEFGMGGSDENAQSDEKPVHRVRVSSFYIGKYPVTQAMWEAVDKNKPCHFTGDNLPVENVSWYGAQRFIKQLNEKTGRRESPKYSLPTESEWEYAARGGVLSKGYVYAGGNDPEEVAWFAANSDKKPHPVGLKKPNELGLFDMSGNVAEWCEDYFGGAEYYQICHNQGVVENPCGPDSDTYHVHRGGAWGSPAKRCRVSNRLLMAPEYRINTVGFRLVLG
ncbi:MAG: formylglycine-generating enzyme family protein [Bacteroidia bacterium]